MHLHAGTSLIPLH